MGFFVFFKHILPVSFWEDSCFFFEISNYWQVTPADFSEAINSSYTLPQKTNISPLKIAISIHYFPKPIHFRAP